MLELFKAEQTDKLTITIEPPLGMVFSCDLHPHGNNKTHLGGHRKEILYIPTMTYSKTSY